MAAEPFGVTADGRSVTRWTLSNPWLRLRVLDLGATVQGLELIDQDGGTTDVVLGHDDVAGYESAPPAYLGAVVGRFANRIDGARFHLDGGEYRVAATSPDVSLHGGPGGFHTRSWSVSPSHEGAGLRLTLVSPDGDQGYPGTLRVTVDYRLDPASARVLIRYRAVTDRPTIVNLTQHTYFCLGGPGVGVDGQLLTVAADTYLPVDARGIPVGGLVPVDGTPFDLRKPVRIGDVVRARHPDLIAVRGLDHTFGLTGRSPAAVLSDPVSGRSLSIRTTEPGLQVYAGNHLDGSRAGKNGVTHRQGDGIALETHHFPDSPNRPDFPTVVLRPGATFESTTEWRFLATPPG